MPDIYYDVDVALTEVPVNVLPLIDNSDFKTIEDAVAYNAAGMALYWHFVTSAGAYTVTAVTPTTGGTYDWTDQGAAGIYTIEIPASGGASINNDTEGYGWFTGSAIGVLPWRGPVIGFRAAALNDALCDGGDNLDVNTVQINGNTQNATGLGYVGGFVHVSSAGSAGTTVGVNGTAANPCSTIASAITVAEARGVKAIRIISASATETWEAPASAALGSYQIDLHGGRLDVNSAGAADFSSARFCSTIPGGTLLNDLFGGPGIMTLEGNNYDGVFLVNPRLDNQRYIANCGIEGPIRVLVGGGAWVTTFTNCYAIQETTTLDMGSITGSTIVIRFAGGSGDISVTNMRAGQKIEFYGYGGNVTIAASCTGGTIKYTAHMEVTNNGSGMTMELVSVSNAAEVADAVWDEARSGHVAAGSFGQYVLARDDSAAALATAASVAALPNAVAIATAVWAVVVVGSYTAIQIMRGLAAALLGKLSGAGTATEVIRAADDSKDVITATVDASGNRTTVTKDLT